MRRECARPFLRLGRSAPDATQLTAVLTYIGLEVHGADVRMPFQPTDFDESMRMTDASAFTRRSAEALRAAAERLVEAASNELASA